MKQINNETTNEDTAVFKEEPKQALMHNARNFVIADLAAKDDYLHTQFCTVAVSPERTQVTDGHVAMQVAAAPIGEREFPVVQGAKRAHDYEQFNLSREDSIKLSKDVPKGRNVKLNPIIAHVGIGEEVGKNGHVDMLLTQDCIDGQVSRFTKVEGKYHDIDRVMPTRENATLRIGFDVSRLTRTFKTLEKVAGKNAAIAMRFQDGNKAVRIDALTPDGQTVVTAVMPLRISDAL